MIRIGQPFVYDEGEYAYLKAKIEISDGIAAAYLAASKVIKKVHWRTSENYPPVEWLNDNSGLWFAVPIEYKAREESTENGLQSDGLRECCREEHHREHEDELHDGIGVTAQEVTCQTRYDE